MNNNNAKLPIKPYTQKELAEKYGVCSKTMGAWLKRISKHVGEKHGWFYNIRQVEIILDRLGTPGKTKDLEND